MSAVEEKSRFSSSFLIVFWILSNPQTPDLGLTSKRVTNLFFYITIVYKLYMLAAEFNLFTFPVILQLS